MDADREVKMGLRRKDGIAACNCVPSQRSSLRPTDASAPILSSPPFCQHGFRLPGPHCSAVAIRPASPSSRPPPPPPPSPHLGHNRLRLPAARRLLRQQQPLALQRRLRNRRTVEEGRSHAGGMHGDARGQLRNLRQGLQTTTSGGDRGGGEELGKWQCRIVFPLRQPSVSAGVQPEGKPVGSADAHCRGERCAPPPQSTPVAAASLPAAAAPLWAAARRPRQWCPGPLRGSCAGSLGPQSLSTLEAIRGYTQAES